MPQEPAVVPARWSLQVERPVCHLDERFVGRKSWVVGCFLSALLGSVWLAAVGHWHQ